MKTPEKNWENEKKKKVFGRLLESFVFVLAGLYLLQAAYQRWKSHSHNFPYGKKSTNIGRLVDLTLYNDL